MRNAAFGVVFVAGLSSCTTEKAARIELADGTYNCHGETHIDTLLNASAEVVNGKIRPGLTGTDIYVGHKVMNWGAVRRSSSSAFSVQMIPTDEVVDNVGEPFWIECQLEAGS